MGWEDRNGRSYYYRKRRDPLTGRVHSLYFGNGARAQQAALEDAAQKRRSTSVDVANIRHVKKEPDGRRSPDELTQLNAKKEVEVANIRHVKKEPDGRRAPDELTQVNAKKDEQLGEVGRKKETTGDEHLPEWVQRLKNRPDHKWQKCVAQCPQLDEVGLKKGRA